VARSDEFWVMGDEFEFTVHSSETKRIAERPRDIPDTCFELLTHHSPLTTTFSAALKDLQ
jgi:hypothetical protein